MKKIGIQIGFLLISLICTLQVKAGSVKMGGFQVQVEEREDTEAQTEQNNDENQEQILTIPAGKTQEEEENGKVVQMETQETQIETQIETKIETQIETQIETPVPQAEGWEVLPVEDTAEQETEIWAVPQAAAGSEEEEADSFFDMVQEGAVMQEEVIDTVRDEQTQEEGLYQGEQDGNEKEKQKICFAHRNLVRFSGKDPLAIQLEGGEEVCVLSCTVNHMECAYRWEEGCLLPVEPLLRKGMNCMEISVICQDGQVFFMEPWYFSCGVGPAML